MEDKNAGRREAYMELVRDNVISLEEAASRLNVSKEDLKKNTKSNGKIGDIWSAVKK